MVEILGNTEKVKKTIYNKKHIQFYNPMLISVKKIFF